ncbi:type 1 glutamine amidotransferase domain-containing protein [Massilia aurea]|jgi:protease I|uniref:type 1 glutamine amidotransferase domain-containing protein n=1 Tax=Massilia aurea TaxID=373040 RepID=UPI00216251EA|nr:type 1 glutamine amidotransferase domain-containing protein [Massilia aurea]MCS0707785.1 type 1 glutamine amidotransferase [Massilia aurea]
MQQAENMQPADHLEPAATQSLDGRRVAVLMTDGVEQVEYTKPRQFLEAQGVTVVLISPKKVGEQIQGFNHLEPGDKYAVELNVEDANADDYDLLLLPGGVANPDNLRSSPESIAFIKAFGDGDKPIAAICHGPWPLIDAGIAESKHMTSWPTLQIDLVNAGAEWTDDEVVVDGKLITSRKPDDIPAFNEAIMKQLMVLQEAGTDPGPTS